MTEETLTLARFEELLDVHGAELARWPEALRAVGEALIAADGRAAELHAQAQALSEVLDVHEASEPSAALRRRVAEIPLRHPRKAAVLELPWLLRAFWRSALAGALVVALGFAAGTALPEDPGAPDAAGAGAQLAQASVEEPAGGVVEDGDDELEVLLELAFLEDEATAGEEW